MRESISGTWVMQLVIAFTLLLVGFLALMVSFSKTFKAKNEVISIIEKYEGLTDKSKEYINSYLQGSGYRATGKCETGWQGKSSLENIVLDSVNSGDKYYYCIKEVYNDSSRMVYYELKMFYVFQLPILGKFATFEVKGSTIDLKSW